MTMGPPPWWSWKPTRDRGDHTRWSRRPPRYCGDPSVIVGTPPAIVGPPRDRGNLLITMGPPLGDRGVPTRDRGDPLVTVGTPPVAVGTPPVGLGPCPPRNFLGHPGEFSPLGTENRERSREREQGWPQKVMFWGNLVGFGALLWMGPGACHCFF